jgi:hypothetical protein
MSPSRIFLLLGALLAAACSNLDPAGGGGTSCATRSGNYLAHFVERAGGSCGALPDQLVGDSAVDTMCTGSANNAADQCTSSIDATCAGVTGAPYTEKGSGTWASDGLTGTATLTYVLYGDGADSPATCTSTYDVTYTKQ